ncbi:uncharacterized protein AAES06_006915 [Glossophaga mutica]
MFLSRGTRERRRREGPVGRVRRVPPAPFLGGPRPAGANGKAVTSSNFCVTRRVPPPTRGQSVVARIRPRGLRSGHLDRLGPTARSHLAAPCRTLPHLAAPYRTETSRRTLQRTTELGRSDQEHPTPSMPGQRRRRGSSGTGHRRQRGVRTRTARAELLFSVSHLERLLREGHYAQHLTSSAPVFLAAIVQYLTATVLQLAGNEAQRSGCRRITPQLVDMAIHNNALLSVFFGSTTISQVAPGWQ